jgi:CHAT domain
MLATHDREPQPGGVEAWPDWRISSENASELARYVDVTYTRSWVPADCRGPWRRSADGATRAGRLYEAVRGHRIGYADEQWNPARHDVSGRAAYQRIRGPEETMLGPATCLDLALVYVGMASCAGIRAFVGLRTGEQPHALVILDTSAPLTGPASLGDRPQPPWFQERRDDPGVWDTAGGVAPGAAFVRLAESDGWLVVDIVRAACSGGDEGVPFSQASGRTAAKEASNSAGSQQWTLVDVDRVLSRQDRLPYRPPAVFPPIHAYLPALPSFAAYPSRQGVLTRLTEVLDDRRAAVVVLQAPQGFGKSMLAHQLALGADNGCGWFLDATDPKALTASLARAQRREDQADETTADGEKPDPGSDRAFASAALERLRGTRLPWVVVLDNCDLPPETPGLLELMPVPRHPGQVVIITTVNDDWIDAAARYDWQLEQLSPLAERDHDDLPAGIQAAVAGRPLIARALSALENRGAVLPGQTDLDGPELVWDLTRELPGQDPDVIATARSLAWCPPEPLNLASVLEAAGGHEPTTGEALLDLRLVTPSDSGSGTAVGMHRLFAQAIRTQTWRDAPWVAGDIVGQLMTSDAGQRFFIDAAEETALVRLERGEKADQPGEAARAAETLTDKSHRGLIWWGLGHIRERRGPVSESLPPFRRAAESLDPADYPFQRAESLIGQARVTYQAGSSTDEQLKTAGGIAEDARRLLEPLTQVEARQLREQGNALAWLIRRRLAGSEPDLAKRSALLIDVRDHLWRSYEERRRIARPDHDASPRSAPVAKDGLGAERAYYNLAGVYIQLAKTRHKLAQTADAGERQALLALAAEDLAGAAAVYQDVRVLREVRYHGRPHPHLAACVQGEAIVAYYRATLLGETARLPDALGFASTAMEQRHKIASGLIGPTRSVLSDNDVRKSVDLMMKAATAAIIGRRDHADEGIAAALKVFEEAAAEARDAPRGEELAPAASPENLATRSGGFSVRPGPVDSAASPDPVNAVRAGPPRRRRLRGECPDNVRIGKPFSLLARIVLSEGGVQLKSFAVPAGGLDVLIVVHAPGLTMRGDHMATLRVPADEDSEPVKFELQADQPGPSRVFVTAWREGNYLGELTLEVTARHEAPVSRTRDRSADLSTETVDGAVSLVVRYEPRDNLYRFRFHDIDNPREEPCQLSYQPGPRLESLIEDLEKVAGGESGYSRQEARDYLIDAGTKLWRELLPERLRQQFWDRRDRIRQLTILADNDTVPWELLYPNDRGRTAAGFLVEQFPVTRDVFERPPPPATLNFRPSRFVRPAGSPSAADGEIAFLRELFEAAPADEVIAEFTPLRELIHRGNFGLLHFACHNEFFLDRGSAINFGGRSFTTTNMETAIVDLTLKSYAPLVFINACRSAGLAATYNRLDSWAEAFLQAGAAAFVGSQWAVGDRTARKFAELFYSRLKAGDTLGEAAMSVRRPVSDHGGDPTWLAYAVYGNPRARLAEPTA